jgi:hypothetical protein
MVEPETQMARLGIEPIFRGAGSKPASSVPAARQGPRRVEVTQMATLVTSTSPTGAPLQRHRPPVRRCYHSHGNRREERHDRDDAGAQ